MLRIAKKEGRTELSAEQQAEYDALVADVAVDPVHQRRYVFGTDALGRDLLARTIYGGQISIMIGFIGTVTALLIGILFGAVAGYLGGWVDIV